MARIAFDCGARLLGVSILELILELHRQAGGKIRIQDAFVQPGAPMETLGVAGDIVAWLRAGVLDALIRKHAYSCYFSGPNMIPYMQELEQTEYLHPDIARRIATMKAAIHASRRQHGWLANVR